MKIRDRKSFVEVVDPVLNRKYMFNTLEEAEAFVEKSKAPKVKTKPIEDPFDFGHGNDLQI